MKGDAADEIRYPRDADQIVVVAGRQVFAADHTCTPRHLHPGQVCAARKRGASVVQAIRHSAPVFPAKAGIGVRDRHFGKKRELGIGTNDRVDDVGDGLDEARVDVPAQRAEPLAIVA